MGSFRERPVIPTAAAAAAATAGLTARNAGFAFVLLGIYCVCSGYAVVKLAEPPAHLRPQKPSLSTTGTDDAEEEARRNANPEMMREVAEAREAMSRGSFFDRLAFQYDSLVSMDELVMLMPLVRRWLVGHAKGDVLELGAGTGRNSEYYKKEAVTRVTILDSSAKMMVKAGRPAKEIPFRRLVADARRLPLADGSFDSVVATFLLCSVDDQAGPLREALRVLRPGGKLLLLDHGSGHYDWLNRLLRRTRDGHLRRWGCVHDLDIGETIRQALRDPEDDRELGRVVESHRYHFGTTWFHVIEKA